MSGSQTTFARRSQGLLSRIAPDRRRHKRIVVELLGRFMRENKQEHACKLIDISAGGAAIKPMAPVAISVGERVVAFFDHVGGIEGTRWLNIGETTSGKSRQSRGKVASICRVATQQA